MIGVVLLALLPVALLIGLGYGLRRSGFLGEAFWPQAERLAYYVLLPALFLHSLATADLEALPIWDLARVLVATTVIVSGVVVALRPLMRLDGADFTSVFQGSIRFNSYIGVTLAAGLFGPHGLALAAVCNAAIVPTVNLICVLVFARFGTARLSGIGIMIQIATNPLLLGCVGGILLQMLHLPLPPWLEPALRALGAASLPLGLICVGAALTFASARSWAGPLLISSAMKFAVMPLTALLAGRALGVGAEALVVAVLFKSLPTASSSYILARQLGGNAPLMAGIVAMQTVLAAIAIPLVFAVFAG